MKEMCLQKLMDLVIFMQLSTALSKVLHPIEACILKFGRDTLFYSLFSDISYEYARGSLATDILSERGRHELYTAPGQYAMRFLLIHPKVRISASILVQEEVAKGRM